ncbi:MAG TPA: FxsA family protein [Egibacteraceae bacterium]
MPALLVIAFVTVPLVELYLAIRVAEVIGGWWTVALLVAISVVGATVVRREGGAAWRRFRDALADGRLPAVEVVDGALVILGGALLVLPGFFSDVVGLLLVLPPTRALVNRLVRARVTASLLGSPGRVVLPNLGAPGRGRRRTRARRDDVIDVEVISVERDEPPPASPTG